MDEIRRAFLKVKEEMEFLKRELSQTKSELNFTKQQISSTQKQLFLQKHSLERLRQTNRQTDQQTNTREDSLNQNNPTLRQINSTFQHSRSNISTHTQQENSPYRPLKDNFLQISTGNNGVPADRQTDRPTDRQTQNLLSLSPRDSENPLQSASEVLDSLDLMKKAIRRKLKQMTDQEFLVFSTIYQLEESSTEIIDYTLLAQKLQLTESSIRDYVARLLKKQVPLDKKKINNKKISLSIPLSFKKLTSLSTMIQLRDL